ncbi:NAD-dependent epimerase/dehydratase family protein [Vibrio alginolyticus]|uniref:NAD-dependent epimerase/dehydratase family protein n=1 Tax=Vibrio TaxID=662 RepID=UPI001CDC4F44|nr:MULTISPECIES: NAD-dependent epimerase/dehydratase family protein [Vibrio]EJL6723892.1 NAD-dependent epimerase/dehydratase family protein [Vibrio alginolyticus]EJL6789759.1 NAD-dependent epimerase/dehydratase family protein [Vibrio alginolyticus]MCA2482762.1 NAD-dependent epimerase/dehydratase family protein [Vibrio alginolyticus]MDW2279097.1 NAD-dependent epimerase/dehydratase family protein [Vibrio sp. 1402]
MTILVTGATGFIGRALISRLAKDKVTGLARSLKPCSKSVNWVQFDLENILDSKEIPGKYETVVHLAARAHILNETSDDPLAEFLRFNRDVSIELARQMFYQGMKRFVFISSIGVNGAKTEKGDVFNESSTPRPETDYGKSKLEAELGLKALSEELGFELVIIRPPLVYGEGAPGNFGKLMKLLQIGLPLPFGAVNNKKSYVSVTNLVDFIATCCLHSDAKNQTFLVADDDVTSTKELLVNLSNNKVVLLPVPSGLLHTILCLVGRKAMSTQLLSDLVIDNTHAKQVLGWQPLESTKDALNSIKIN